ncbi:cation diffusion facilitator family transporter [Halomarina litorea]|uniref:cation diffusion facilitator family transporter n=1 Tax=Halomarina litorea TaxID=2961595 RepID=UPI0020C23962|nr:cation diffusion facilitator family transporter [Halomarina sp. BCD28]
MTDESGVDHHDQGDEAPGPPHDHDPGHGHGGSASSRKLALVSAINIVGFVVELAGGLLFGSVALISDAVHMLFDALAYVMAFTASYVADRYEGSEWWSYGLHRLEPLAAFLNGVLLIPMVGYILWESYQRFLTPIEVGTVPTIVIAIGGLAVNVGSVFILQGGEMSLNEKGAFYHLLGDAGGSIAVIVSVVVVEVTGITVIDPIAAALIAGIVLWSAGKVLRGSGAIFFMKTPFQPEHVREEIEAVDGVDHIDDWHAWQICSQITVATAHVETSVETMSEADTVTQQIHHVLEEHGVDHATIELSPGYGDRRTHLNSHAH